MAEQTVYVPSRAFKSRRVFDGAVETAGLPRPETVETNSGRVAQALVATGSGVAVVTEDPSFGLVPLLIRNGAEDLTVTLHVIWRQDHYARESLRALAAELQAFVTERYPAR